MKKRRRFFSLLPALVLWMMASVLVWGFVFTRITDTSREKKITLCVDAPVRDETGLAVRLEEGKGENIRMVKARAFTYAMFDTSELMNADLFIVPLSHAETYRDWFGPLPEDMRDAAPCLAWDGTPLGLLIYDAQTGAGAARAYIDYPGAEDYYLFFGAASLHAAGRENAVDNEAVSAARRLMEIP